MCTATFSAPVSGTSKCQLSAIFAVSSNQTAISLSGTLMGSSYTWQGLSFDIDGRPSSGTLDLAHVSGATGEIGDGVSDAWTLSGGGTGASMGTLGFGIDSAKVTASVASGDIYELHGSGSAKLAYTGSRNGIADVTVTLSY